MPRSANRGPPAGTPSATSLRGEGGFAWRRREGGISSLKTGPGSQPAKHRPDGQFPDVQHWDVTDVWQYLYLPTDRPLPVRMPRRHVAHRRTVSSLFGRSARAQPCRSNQDLHLITAGQERVEPIFDESLHDVPFLLLAEESG